MQEDRPRFPGTDLMCTQAAQTRQSGTHIPVQIQQTHTHTHTHPQPSSCPFAALASVLDAGGEIKSLHKSSAIRPSCGNGDFSKAAHELHDSPILSMASVARSRVAKPPPLPTIGQVDTCVCMFVCSIKRVFMHCDKNRFCTKTMGTYKH